MPSFKPVIALLNGMLHTIIEVAYLARGKTAPEPEQVVA